uniref:Uncharacterized protein n=1 Tax=Ditylenchus dipsaci TaxID=166011 RepID=A0A915EE07_9BILA
MSSLWSILEPKYLILMTTFCLFSNAYRIDKQTARYIRPECLPNESCLYSALGYRFEMCTCPGLLQPKPCQANRSNAAFSFGVTYNFCSESQHIPNCKPEEDSMTVEGLRTFIHCTCNEESNSVLRARTLPDTSMTIFVCTQQEIIET